MGVRNTIPAQAKKLDRAIREELSAFFVEAGQELAGMMQKAVRDLGAVASGLLVGNIFPIYPPAEENTYRLQVGTPIEHGAFLEFGTKAHWPPFAPIRRWVEMKIQPHVLSVGVSFESGKARPTRRGTKVLKGDRREQIIDQVARMIQRKIAQTGMRPRAWMARSLDQMGLKYKLREDTSNGELVYDIDTLGFVEKRAPDLWARIAARIG